MDFFEKVKTARAAIEKAETEHRQAIEEAQKRVAELEAEQERSIASSEAALIELKKSWQQPVASLGDMVLYPGRLVYRDQELQLSDGVETDVSVGTGNVFLSVKTPNGQTTYEGKPAEEIAIRRFSDTLANHSLTAAAETEAFESRLAEAEIACADAKKDSAELKKARRNLKSAEANVSDIENEQKLLKEMLANATEEELQELHNGEEAERLEEEAKAAEVEARQKHKQKMMLTIGGIAAVAAFIIGFLFSSHVLCFHRWSEPSCTTASVCLICGREGTEKALGHDWEEATCEQRKRCKRCLKVEGDALGHEWIEATCEEPKKCGRCGKTEGDALGHDFGDASCTEDSTCSRCGEIRKAPGHTWVEATCTDAKTCSVCGTTEGEPLGHTTDFGVCSRCGKEFLAPITGSGDDVISDISTKDGLYRAHISYSGGRNFVVWVHDASGDRDLLVNTIGSYDGYVILLGDSPYTFEIESSGQWSVELEDIPSTSETSFSGVGDYVTGVFKAKSGTWEFTHSGSSNFAVWVYTTDGRDLLINEIGEYNGKRYVSIPSGSNAILVVEADGAWTAAPE